MLVPVQLELPCEAVEITSGGEHSMILCENGEVYAMGVNQSGQFGINKRLYTLQPVLVQLPSLVTFVYAFNTASIIVMDGKLYAAGAKICKRMPNNEIDSDKIYAQFTECIMCDESAWNIKMCAAFHFHMFFLK